MGAQFRIPIAFVEGLDTGDGRHFRLGQWQSRALPLSLGVLFSEPEMGGHGGAVVAGRVDTLDRRDITTEVDPATGRTWGDLADGQVWGWAATGELADTDEAQKATDLIRGGFLRGVSADLAEVTWEEEVIAVDEDGWPTDVKLVGGPGMIGGLTVVNLPGFRACTIELVDDAGTAEPAPPALAAAGAPWLPSARETETECLPCREAQTVTAAGGPLAPPREWFENPGLQELTPLTIEDDGRIYGHLADWTSCHIGFQGRCINPPRSLTSYALFHVGAVRCSDGSDVAVGHVTLDTGHASTARGVDAAAALAHYDNTGTVVADIAVGEDEFGPWVAGALRPDVSDLQVRRLRSASLSGDWRPYGRGSELVAALAVNVPGFPIPRAMAAGGAIVAAGVLPPKTRETQVALVVSREAVDAAVREAMAPYRLKDARARLAAAGVAGP